MIYDFKWNNRPFKFITEAYYKYVDNEIPYSIDNVKIRYRARNNAVAYATGIDFRLNGEFVPGTESWLSVGYLVTKENIDKFLDDMIRLSPSPQTLKSERGDFFGLRDQLRRNRRFIDNKKMRRKKK